MESEPTITLIELTEPEERRVVHILAALREHLKDELKYIAADLTDPRSTVLAPRAMMRMHAYLWNELTNCMCGTHVREAERLGAYADRPMQETERRFFCRYEDAL